MKNNTDIHENTKQLSNRINQLKEKIYYLIDNTPTITSTEVLSASQELDLVINTFLKSKEK